MRRLAVFLTLLAMSCASSRPVAEAPIAPLTATSSADALRELAARRAQLPGARSLLRVRAGQQSFKAQMRVQGNRLGLTVYTPFNTSAATLFADGDRVTFLNHMELTQWQGDASELAGSLGLFASTAKPSDLGYLLLGFPASAGEYDATASGLAHATIGSVSATFDPPSLPAQRVVVERNGREIVFEQLEVTATDEELRAPKIPRDYQQGGVPRL